MFLLTSLTSFFLYILFRKMNRLEANRIGVVRETKEKENEERSLAEILAK